MLVFALASGCSSQEQGTWEDFDAQERLEYMNEVVFPTMREIFQEEDPERFAGFSCESCHGSNRLEVDHAMPNALGPLPLDGTLEAAEARNPQMTAFMLDDVFPVIVDLLDYERFSHDENPDGFRCTGCHLVAD